MKTTIYTAYHKHAPLIEGPSIVPIHVGRSGKAPLSAMIGDDTGESISDRNAAYCELTALYWAWKNDHDSDYIGLMHYRRMLDVTDSQPMGSVEAKPDRFEIKDWVAAAEGWIGSDLQDFDVVLPRTHSMGRTVKDNYTSGHEAQDFDCARAIIAKDHPDYLNAFDKVASGRNVRLGNMAIMKRAMFEQYCTWLFDILFKIEAKDLRRETYTQYQNRYLGFLAERLFTVFIAHSGDQLRKKEVSILNLSDSLMIPSVTAPMRLGNDSIAVAFAADRAYLPHAAAMVRSVLDHADPSRPIDFLFLYSGVGARGLSMLREVMGGHNARLHAVDIGGAFKDSYRSASRAPSNATYNRFLLFDLLSGFDRLIYLDADVIVRTDISALFDTDMGGAEIGGVTDWIMTRTLTGPTPTADPDTPDLVDHHRTTLGLNDEQIARYFNAGVLLLDFAAMGDVSARGSQLMAEVETGKYLFRDQDILNKVFKDDLFVLDGRWNVFNTGIEAFGRVPAAGHAKAVAAKAEPWIIHYADRDYKPWDKAAVPLSQHYWQCLIRTPFYGEVIGHKPPKEESRTRPLIVETGLRLSEKYPALRAPLLRFYATLRRLMR